MTKSPIVRSRPAQSVLDFGIVPPGRAGPAELADSLELAGRHDRHGYHRHSLSEQHETHFCW
ncbi:LLM class flavin-dependent oxidoreductase, partial [Burkholderia pseudomallei]